jgi:hypothetical protein
VAKGKTIIYLRDDETAFLNVDVDVIARSPLDALAAALGERVSLHYLGRRGRGQFQLSFSLYNPRTADSAILGIVKLIESLPRSTRRLWTNASQRVFDVGYQGGLTPHSRKFDITPQAVAAIVNLDGAIRVTIYVAPAVESLTRRVRP